MIMNKNSTQSAKNQLLDIQRVASDYDWPQVVELTTQLLANTDLPPETAVSLLRYRGNAYEHLGQFEEEVADLETAVSMAQDASQTCLQIETLLQLADVSTYHDEEGRLRNASIALTLAEQIGDQELAALSHQFIALAQFFLGDYTQLQLHGQRARELGKESSSRRAEAGGYFFLALAAWHSENDEPRAAELFRRSLRLYRQLGDKRRLAEVHHFYGVATTDLAAALYSREQALNLEKAIKLRPWISSTTNAVAFAYWKLGLYHRALQLIE